MQILPVEAKIFQADFRSYMTNLIVAFRNAANTSKNYHLHVPGQQELHSTAAIHVFVLGELREHFERALFGILYKNNKKYKV
jgi:hypothetical protein